MTTSRLNPAIFGRVATGIRPMIAAWLAMIVLPPGRDRRRPGVAAVGQPRGAG